MEEKKIRIIAKNIINKYSADAIADEFTGGSIQVSVAGQGRYINKYIIHHHHSLSYRGEWNTLTRADRGRAKERERVS